MKMVCNSCDGKYDSLDVRFTKACDNSCSFCIERDGIGSLGNTDVDKMISSCLESGIKSVLILGGEPFLLPDKLLRFVEGIRNNVETIYITTSLPNSFIHNKEVCHRVLDLVDGLNVSIQYAETIRNNEILVASSKHNRLEILCELNRKYASKTRVNLNLVKGSIDNNTKLRENLDVLSSIGCKNIKLNELQNSPDLYVSYEDMTESKLPSPFSSGCQTRLGDYKEMTITLKRSCFCTEPSRKAGFMDVVKAFLKRYYEPKNKFQVMYENGFRAYSWEKEKKEC